MRLGQIPVKAIFAFCIPFFFNALSAIGGPSHFVCVDVEQGLSQNTVNCILQDSKGYLWIGTQDGLNRYDGYTITVFRNDPGNAHSLSHNIVRTIYEDSQQTLWIGTEGGGLNRFDRKSETFESYRYHPNNASGISSDYVYDIMEDSHGRFWIGTFGGGLNRMDREAGTFVRYEHDPANAYSLSCNSVKVLAEDHWGNFWVGTGTGGNGVNSFDPGKEIFYHYGNSPDAFKDLTCGSVNSIVEDRSGVLWIGTWDEGIIRFYPPEKKASRLTTQNSALQDNIVRSLYCDHRGDIWVGTWTAGLQRWCLSDPAPDVYQPHPEILGQVAVENYAYDPDNENGLRNNSIRFLFEDNCGMLWIGTNASGLHGYNLKQKPFLSIPSDKKQIPPVSNLNTYAITESGPDDLWLGMRGGGLLHWNRSDASFESIVHQDNTDQTLSRNSILALRYDPSGYLWIGTDGGGLDQYHVQSKRFRHLKFDSDDPESLGNNAVHALFLDHENTLWVGTWEGGLNRYNRETNTFTRYPVDDRVFGRNVVIEIYEDRENRLWVGTSRIGPMILDRETGVLHHYPVEKDTLDLYSSMITSIFQSSDGAFWFGTGGNGLIRCDEKTKVCRRYGVEDGLPHNSVSSLREDQAGNLWIATEYGISKLDVSGNQFFNFDKQDGLRSNVYNMGAVATTSRGELAFGSIEGLTYFHPEEILIDTVAPPVVISNLLLFNQPVQIGQAYSGYVILPSSISELENIQLSYKHFALSFEFAALHYVMPFKNRYAYRLKGFESQWNYTTADRRFATYTNLKPGKYTFEVKGANSDGFWNETGTRLNIQVVPPFWQRWWFRAAMVAMLIIMILCIVHTRTRFHKIRANQLEILVNERTQKLESAQKQLLLQERMAALGQVIATVAHEIRNPLGTVRSAIFSIGETAGRCDETRLNRALSLAERNIIRCDNILTELLDFTRNKDLKLKKIDLDTWLKRLLVEQEFPKNVKLEMDLQSEMICEVSTEDLRRAVINVINNAVQAMAETSLPEGRDHDLLRVETYAEHGRIHVVVIDSGPGIKKEELDKIFEPLYSTKPFGIGLGLSIVRKIMQQHQGGFELKSEAGQGTTADLWIPYSTEKYSGADNREGIS